MRLRRASLADMPVVAALHRTTLRVSLPFLPELHTAEDDRRFFSGAFFEANRIWIAEDETGLAGYAAIAAGWLNHLYIHPDRQGQGLGGLLLAKAMEEEGELQLWAFQKNTRARAIYEAKGFVLVRLTDGADNEEREPDALYRWTRPVTDD